MKLNMLAPDFSICMLADLSEVDFSRPFCFFGRTDAEISLVCPTQDVPQHVLRREDGWRAFCIEGVLDFSLIGILADISGCLAAQQIGIFVLSTYCTDYILTKAADVPRAVRALRNAGYELACSGTEDGMVL